MNQFYLNTYMTLSVYAVNKLSNREAAEDAVQEAFRIGCTRIDDLMTSPNPEGWIMNTLKNVIRSAWRNQSRRQGAVVSLELLEEKDVPLPADNARPQEDLEMEMVYVQLLGEEDYRLFKRVVIQGVPCQEAATEFSLSYAACVKRVQRSRKKLRKFFEENEM